MSSRFRVLLTGANGQLARLFCAGFETISSSIEVIPITRHTAWTLDDPLCGLDKLGRVDVVLHMAAPTPAGPTGNYAATVPLARAAQQAAQRLGARLIVLSSQAVYGASVGRPFAETDPIAPQNDYGRAKAAMEKAVGDGAVILRLGNVVGTDQLGRNLRRGTPVTLDRFADGYPQRSYIGPMTLVRALVFSIETGLPAGLYNLAAPKPVAMDALVQAFGVEVWAGDMREGAAQITLDLAKIARLFAFEPSDSDPQVMVDQFLALQTCLEDMA